ncbi:dTDP-4-dehydrorhamnose reductase [Desulfogranum mediterraneum]|uniref:dTDP-4-dehydrorhamnose reductase n=1 Tax=Desulfogranum mediterraneum TaxID=160661 RepID=UPI000424AD40|nr:dTDP-4-dehydrorhamnose reductase [Desulfogranum mediterraneum]
MKLLIIGANGQLGQDCLHTLSPKHTVACCDVQDMDITDGAQVAALFAAHRPEAVINCAAYTAVDNCETDQQRCLEVNALGPQLLAEQCAEYNTRLLQISTDYVYDGALPAPQAYREDAAARPLSVYGQTKLKGDQAVQSLTNHLIIRTAWLYGMGGKNFLKTMLRLAVADPERTIRVVNDQYGSLTWSWRLAAQIELLLEHELTGIIHASAENHSSWYEGARFFLDCMQVPYSMEPCTTEEYPTPAPRPANSILENHRLKQAGLNLMVDWKEDVARMAREYRAQLLEEAGG